MLSDQQTTLDFNSKAVNELYIAGDGYHDNHYTGLVDDVYLFDRVLAEDEINQLSKQYGGEAKGYEKIDVWTKEATDPIFSKVLTDRKTTLDLAKKGADNLYLGGDQYKDNSFEGNIDNVYVFDRVLPEHQIQNLDQDYRGMPVKWRPTGVQWKRKRGGEALSPYAFWNFDDCNFKSVGGSISLNKGSRASCNKGGGTDGSDAVRFTGGKSMVFFEGFSKTFPNGLTISARFQQTAAGGIWGLGSTAGHHHLYIRSNWNCHGRQNLALGADNGGDTWFCIAKDACGKSTQIQGGWHSFVGTWRADNRKADIYMKRPGEDKFCKVLSNQATTLDFKSKDVKKLFIGGDGYNDNPFQGTIDDVFLFDRVLNEEEINYL